MAVNAELNIRTIDEAMALRLLPERPPGAHKWSVGGLVIIGGAPGYIGAPALCARAAGRSGAGIVSVVVSRATVGPVATLVPEATFVPLPEGDPQHTAQRAADLIRERVEQSDAVVVGPGLSRDEHAQALLAALFTGRANRSGSGMGFGVAAAHEAGQANERVIGASKLAVVDADALNWLAGQPSWWENVEPMTLILTPHEGEFARLIESDVERIREERETTATDAAARWRQVVVLKGSRTIVTDGAATLAGPQTPASLATAGSGDVLAGSIGAFLAQGLSPMDAVALAIHVGAEAARAVEQEYGSLAVIATDLPDAIGRVLAQLERRRNQA